MMNNDDAGSYYEALYEAQLIEDAETRDDLRKYGVVGGYLLEWAREIPVGVSALDDVAETEAA